MVAAGFACAEEKSISVTTTNHERETFYSVAAQTDGDTIRVSGKLESTHGPIDHRHAIIVLNKGAVSERQYCSPLKAQATPTARQVQVTRNHYYFDFESPALKVSPEKVDVTLDSDEHACVSTQDDHLEHPTRRRI